VSEELEPVAHYMIKSVENIYQQKTTLPLPACSHSRCTIFPHDVQLFPRTKPPGSRSTRPRDWKHWCDHGFSSRSSRTSRRINAQCKDPLEVSFTHGGKMGMMLENQVNNASGPDISLCRAFLAQMKIRTNPRTLLIGRRSTSLRHDEICSPLSHTGGAGWQNIV